MTRRRRVVVAVSVLAAVLVALSAATARLFVWPRRDQPRPVDAVVMFDGGSGNDRYNHAVDLVRRGFAPVLVLSNPSHHRRCVADVPGVQVICFQPRPRTTQGEARAVATLAREHGWRSVLLVTGRAQDTRARIRMGRCFDGLVLVSPVDPARWRWPYTIAYEWGALVKALTWQRGC